MRACGPGVEAGLWDCLGSVLNGRPSGGPSLSAHREGFAGSHYPSSPSRHAIASIPLDVSTNKAQNRKNIQIHFEMMAECGGE